MLNKSVSCLLWCMIMSFLHNKGQRIVSFFLKIVERFSKQLSIFSMLLYLYSHLNCENIVTVLTLVGWYTLTQSQQEERKWNKKPWTEIRTGRSLTNYHCEENWVNSGRINLNLLSIKTDAGSEKQRQMLNMFLPSSLSTAHWCFCSSPCPEWCQYNRCEGDDAVNTKLFLFLSFFSHFSSSPVWSVHRLKSYGKYPFCLV